MGEPHPTNPSERDEERNELLKTLDAIEPKETHSNPYKKLNSPGATTQIFFVWLIFVILCNVYTPFGRDEANALRHSKNWPPVEIMRKNVDNHKRVVVAMTDMQYVKLADNFLASLEALGIKNFVIVTLDYESYMLLNKAYPGHVLAPMPSTRTDRKGGNAHPNDFDSFVGSRVNMLHAFLEAGYTVFYNDIDSVWKTDVFAKVDDALNETPYLDPASMDGFFINDSRADSTKQISAAHMYLKSTPTTRLFLENWYEMRRGVFLGDYQQSLNDLIRKKTYHSDDKNLSLMFSGATMDTVVGDKNEFPPSWFYFGSSSSQSKMDKEAKKNAWIVHNNSGDKIAKQIALFKKEGLWNPSKRLPEMNSRRAKNMPN